MRIAQINVVASLSTGRIAVSLCRTAMQAGHRALICHSRDHAPADVPSYVIGSKAETLLDLALTRLTDRAGFFSRYATRRLIRQLDAYKPDLVHLHNLHGYYLNLPMLFAWLRKHDLPVVWTLHDCWAYTGHCAYYTMARGAEPVDGRRRRAGREDRLGCDRWLGGCGRCVRRHAYPSSWFLDQSARNWRDKRELFCGLRHMVLTTPSEWLREEVKRSFLSGYPVYALPNGVDLTVFQPCSDEQFMRDVVRFYGLERSGGRRLVISAAAVWDERKGLDDLIDLSEALGPEYCVVAVGLDEYPDRLAAQKHGAGSQAHGQHGGSVRPLHRRRRVPQRQPRGKHGHDAGGGPGLRHAGRVLRRDRHARNRDRRGGRGRAPGRYRRPGRRGAPPVRRPPQRRRLPRPRRRF